MKVLAINTVCGSGSTGRNTVELAEALIAKGHSCIIAYGQGATTYPESFKIGGVLENHMHNAFSRLFGNQGYYSRRGTKALVNFIDQVKPDIIHLGNLHGNYLQLEVLFPFLATLDIPILWTLHDCWAFTGKCTHYTVAKCNRWQDHCGACPQVGAYPPSFFFDRSESMLADKKKWVSSLRKVTIVTVSKWLATQAEQSFLAQHPIVSIYNWIDQAVFHPRHPDVRNNFGIPAGTFVILCVSAHWPKTSTKYNDFCRLAKLAPPGTKMVLVGGIDSSVQLPSNVTHIPYIHDTEALAQIFAMADVYVHLSLEDTFGKVIAESLACGTPAVVYNSTACPEVVGDGCGFVVDKRNIPLIVDAIQKIQILGKSAFSSACVSFSEKTFNYQTNTEKYIDTMQRMLL